VSAKGQVERYLEHVAHAKGLAEKTVLAYRQDLELLVQLHDQLGAWPDALFLRRWVAEQSRADKAPRSIARRLSAWRVFFDWLVMIEPSLKANPVKGLRGPKAARFVAQGNLSGSGRRPDGRATRRRLAGCGVYQYSQPGDA
jgi:integrase/recombinase XerC